MVWGTRGYRNNRRAQRESKETHRSSNPAIHQSLLEQTTAVAISLLANVRRNERFSHSRWLRFLLDCHQQNRDAPTAKEKQANKRKVGWRLTNRDSRHSLAHGHHETNRKIAHTSQKSERNRDPALNSVWLTLLRAAWPNSAHSHTHHLTYVNKYTVCVCIV